jgi:hypothetical protein
MKLSDAEIRAIIDRVGLVQPFRSKIVGGGSNVVPFPRDIPASRLRAMQEARAKRAVDKLVREKFGW